MSKNGSEINIVIAIDHASITGGQAKVALDSALGLKRAGYNPIVFAAVAPVDPRLIEEGVEVVCLDQADLLGNSSKFVAAFQGAWNFRAAKELRRLLSRLPSERTIVHVHGWAKALSASIAQPIRQSGLPCVYTMHEYFMFCGNGGFYDFQSGRVCNLRPMSASCWARNCDSRNYPFKLWRNARLAVAKGVARLAFPVRRHRADFALQEEALAPYLPASARRPPSAQSDRRGRRSAINPARPRAICCSSAASRRKKGVFLFAEAARLAGVTPVFAGDGPALEALRQKYPEARQLGWKSPDEVKALMRNSRVLVFPSLWFEGQPLTVLEAKAMGTPAIVSDGCAAREVDRRRRQRPVVQGGRRRFPRQRPAPHRRRRFRRETVAGRL